MGKLYFHFATHDREKILREMEVDCSIVYPSYSVKQFFQYDAIKDTSGTAAVFSDVCRIYSGVTAKWKNILLTE